MHKCLSEKSYQFTYSTAVFDTASFLSFHPKLLFYVNLICKKSNFYLMFQFAFLVFLIRTWFLKMLCSHLCSFFEDCLFMSLIAFPVRGLHLLSLKCMRAINPLSVTSIPNIPQFICLLFYVYYFLIFYLGFSIRKSVLLPDNGILLSYRHCVLCNWCLSFIWKQVSIETNV